MQLTSTNRAHQPESFEPIPSQIERPKAANPGVHAELWSSSFLLILAISHLFNPPMGQQILDHSPLQC